MGGQIINSGTPLHAKILRTDGPVDAAAVLGMDNPSALARRRRTVPSPLRLVATTTIGSSVPLWMNAAGTKVWGFNSANTGQLVESDGDGSVWSNVGSAFTGRVVVGVRDTSDGELLVSLSNDDVSRTGDVYKTSGYAAGGAVTFTLVKSTGSVGSRFNQMWGMSVYRRTVLLTEYGGYSGQSVRVYLSYDDGVTWTTIADATALGWFNDAANGHLHCGVIDPYQERIWVSRGDGLTNRGVKYSDDWGVTWSDFVINADTRAQFTTIVPLPDCVLFLSDGAPNGVWRWPRGKSTDPKALAVIHNLDPTFDLLTMYGGATYWRGAGYPVLLGFINQKATWTNYLVATWNGYDFFTVWADPADTNGGSGFYGLVGPTSTNKILANYSTAVVTNRLTFTAPAAKQVQYTPLVPAFVEHLRFPGNANAAFSAPFTSAFTVTTSLRLRIRVAMDDWTPSAAQVLMARFGAANHFHWQVNTDGTLQFYWYNNAGVNTGAAFSTAAPTVSDGDWLTLEMYWQATANAGNYRVTYSTSTDYDPLTQRGTWTTLGSVINGGSVGLINQTVTAVPLEIGAVTSGAGLRLAGRVQWAEMWVDGNLVAAPDVRGSEMRVGDTFTAAYTPKLTDAAGNVWSTGGDNSGAGIRVRAESMPVANRDIPAPTVSGSKGANAALTSLIKQLAAQGLITDATT